MALGLPSSHRKYADFGVSRVTDLGTHQCCILATQGKIINANHVPITMYLLSQHLLIYCCVTLHSVWFLLKNNITKVAAFSNLHNVGAHMIHLSLFMWTVLDRNITTTEQYSMDTETSKPRKNGRLLFIYLFIYLSTASASLSVLAGEAVPVVAGSGNITCTSSNYIKPNVRLGNIAFFAHKK